jgi:hypothetical protein
MFRFLKRSRAIKTYVFKLSLELHRRFGDKRFYTLEQVTHILENGRFDKTFSAYAYALFCSQKDFDAYFGQLKLKCTYYGLRKVVAKRYFRRIIDFDAGAVVRFAKGVGNSNYYESGLGNNFINPGSWGHH